jgi:HK97 family phage portal protein
MGIFDIFRREKPKEQSTEVSPTTDDVLLSALIRGDKITREKAETLPAVSGAVDLISGTIASMPIRLFKKTDNKIEEVLNDPRVKMLNYDTGDTLNAFNLKKIMVKDYLLSGGAYVYISRLYNEVTGLFYVKHSAISTQKNIDPIFKKYIIRVNGVEYFPFEFLKVLRDTEDGVKGKSVIDAVSKLLETAYSTLLFQLGMVKNGGKKKGFLKAVKKLSQEEMNKLKKAWNELYADGTENAIVLNNGLDFKEASNTSAEMQLNENKKTLKEEINDVFHIHTNDYWQTFKEAIYPIIKAFETAINADLLLESEKGHLFFAFDTKEVIKPNTIERYKAYAIAKQAGFLTLNEIRREENLNDIDGLDVVNIGLSAALYDTNTKKYYTPNTNATTDLKANQQDTKGQDKPEETVEDKETKEREDLKNGT